MQQVGLTEHVDSVFDRVSVVGDTSAGVREDQENEHQDTLQRQWGSLPSGLLCETAQRLPMHAVAACRLVCSHWHAACSGVHHLALKAVVGPPHPQQQPAATPPCHVPGSAACGGTVPPPPHAGDSQSWSPSIHLLRTQLSSLSSAAIVLPYHHPTSAFAPDSVLSNATQLLSLLALCPQLHSLDIGFRRHLQHEPMLRRTCPAPILASQVPLLPTLVSLSQLQQDSPGSPQPATPRLQLHHLTVLFDTLSAASGKPIYAPKRFRADLPQLTSLRSLVINLRGAFTQDEATCVAALPHLTRLELQSSSTSFLSCRTLQLLAGLTSPLQTLLLGPCILNPTPCLLGVLGTLRSLTKLAAWVKCASPVHQFSTSSLAVRCKQYDCSGLSGVSDLRLVLEGYSEARAVAACLECIANLRSLELVLRGMWQPGWEHLELDDGGGFGGEGGDGGEAGVAALMERRVSARLALRAALAAAAPLRRLRRLALRDERPCPEEEPAYVLQQQGPQGQQQQQQQQAAAAVAGPEGGPSSAAAPSPAAGRAPRPGLFDGQEGQGADSSAPLHALLHLALVPELQELDLDLGPAMGTCVLGRLTVLCPGLRRLGVKGGWRGLEAGACACSCGGLTGGAVALVDVQGEGSSMGLDEHGVEAGKGRAEGAAAGRGKGQRGLLRPGREGGSSSEQQAACECCLLGLAHLRELRLAFSSKEQPHEKGRVDLACLPSGLRVLELENCVVRGCAAAAASAPSPDSNGDKNMPTGVLHPQRQQQQLRSQWHTLHALALRHCSGDVGGAFVASPLTRLELRRSADLAASMSPSLPTSTASFDSQGCEGSDSGSGSAGDPAAMRTATGPGRQCGFPAAWFGLERLHCDCPQRLLVHTPSPARVLQSGFGTCCRELRELRCLTLLSVSLRADEHDEPHMWPTLVGGMPSCLQALHLHLSCPTRMSRDTGGGPAMLQLSCLASLRELKLSGTGGEVPNTTLTKLQRAMPYTAICLEEA